MKLNRILVPVDFDEASRKALRSAIDLAQKYHAALDVLHVCWDPPAYFSNEFLVGGPAPLLASNYIEDHAEAELEKFTADIFPQEIGFELHIRTGNVPKLIVNFAKAHQSDLIVVGTHGRTGISHALLGSVAERVVHTAPCTVLTVKSEEIALRKEHTSALQNFLTVYAIVCMFAVSFGGYHGNL